MSKFITILITFVSAASLNAGDKLTFNEHIRPILSDKCFHCHGPDEKHIKGKLQLHSFEKATANLSKKKSRRAITPGSLKESTLWQRISTQDEDDMMPPPESHKTLSKSEKETLKRWIEEGAEYENHWSFEALKNKANPIVESNWSQHPVDRFVMAGLASKSLKPNSQADKQVLIRRLTFDLTGLPPTAEEIENFIADKNTNAYEKLTDRLLESPRFGEHMARYWLDAVRYGDTHGLHADNYREMYMYRDWVIKAFNVNKPFDQFTVEQIAGDLLENPTKEQLIASGFNRLHISNSAGSALEEELYVNNVKDRVNAVGTVFMGLTLGCAGCHDHKYDPILQKEYYQLFAYFNNLDGPSHNMGVKSPPPSLLIPTPDQQRKFEELRSALKLEKDEKKIKNLKAEIKKLEADTPSTLIMKERKEIRPAYILNRGEYDQKGELVIRNTPAFLPPFPENQPNNRLGLARWLTTPENPLTARVTVNRFWQQLFGVGIVKTSEDFGSQGQWPSHPKLLDYLSYRFIKNGWNVKELMKLIVTSKTYQQSSNTDPGNYKNDPENRLLSRGPRFRMDAEMLRDQALFISGLLVDKMYGKSVKPPQPEGLWKSVALKGSNTGNFVSGKGDEIYRRSVYTFWKRALPPPAMTIFNAPTRENCTARRERTNTPLQALVLMNEEQFFKASIELAKMTLKQGGSTDIQRINYLYKKLTGVEADKAEIEMIGESVKEFNLFFEDSKPVLMAGEKISRETAVWAMLSNSLMGLDKFKCKE